MLLATGQLYGAAGGGGGGDPSFSVVELLCGFDGTDAATTAPDEGPDGRTLTFVGNAQLDTAQQKFGTASLLLDGTGDAVTVPDSTDWAFSGLFTVDVFFRVPAGLANGTYSIVGQYGGGGVRAWRLYWSRTASTRSVSFDYTTDGTTTITTVSGDIDSVLTDTTWVMLSADRDGSNKIRVYLNGVMVASRTSATGAIFNAATTLSIGGALSGQAAFNGWIDEIRITSGVARYASDSGFTPPGAAFPRA